MIPGMETRGMVNLQTAEQTCFARFGMISVCCVALLPLCGAGQTSKPAASGEQLVSQAIREVWDAAVDAHR